MTRTLTLKNRYEGNSTVVENDFIDNYLAKANGEYVKVYLLLLRHLNANTGGLSICGLADCLECTEKDILRAFKYWSKVGLLKIEQDSAGNICGLAIGKSASASEPSVASVTPISMTPAEMQTTSPTQKKAKKVSSEDAANLRQLYFVAEQYLGKPLSSSELKKINYFFDELHFSTDLIEYLIEYCVENNHRSFRYIESVAVKWAEKGIQTVEEAKNASTLYTKNGFAVLKAFGIAGRAPGQTELDFIKKWTEEYAFSLDIIIEACNRTINATHEPSFKYADSILAKWSASNVHHLSDISRLDQAYIQEKETKKRTSTKSSSANRFNNFEGRSYDMKSLEQQLLNTQ